MSNTIADRDNQLCPKCSFHLAGTALELTTYQIFPIYCELKDKTQKRLNTVIAASIGSAAFCYEVVSRASSDTDAC